MFSVAKLSFETPKRASSELGIEVGHQAGDMGKVCAAVEGRAALVVDEDHRHVVRVGGGRDRRDD